MSIIEQTAVQPTHRRVDERSQQSSTSVDPVTRHFVSHSDTRDDKPFSVETAIDTPPKTADSFEPKPSPLLNTIVGRGMAIVAAQELFQANQQLEQEWEVFAEEYHRKKVKDAVDRSRQKRREEDPEAYKAYERERKREYRARKKREAEAQQAQEPKSDEP